MSEPILFTDLLEKYKSPNLIPYKGLLLTIEWATKRNEIIKRDNYRCSKCQKTETMDHYEHGKNYHLWIDADFDVSENQKKHLLNFHVLDDIFGSVQMPKNIEITVSPKKYHLEVHHSFYILEKLPWEYQNESLITFCNWCHWEFHEKNTVPVYTSESMKEIMELTPCKRCNGAGRFPEYSHISSGVCFRCNGRLYEELIR